MIITQKPKDPKKYKNLAQGKINAISKSNTKNNIAIIKKCISKVPRESSNGSKPHS